MQFLFRTDASAGIGGGHVMRCLTLAASLEARGVDISFACASLVPGLERRIREAGYELIRLPERQVSWSEESPWPKSVQITDAEQILAGGSRGASDWIVVDHYGLDAAWEECARTRDAKIAVIDDLADRPHDCDLLLDHTLGRAPYDYGDLVPAGCRLLTGAGYALLRPEFRAQRRETLTRRRDGGRVRRLLVSLGTTDVGGITGRVVRALLESGIDCGMDVVIGSQGESLAELDELARRDPRLALHVDTTEMAQLAGAADLAVGAAGTSSWERCCLGLPTVTLILANNQRLVAQELAKAEAVALRESPADAAACIRALLDDEPRRQRMTAAAAAITDGEGAERVAEELVGVARSGGQRIALRAAGEADAEDIWLWRNDPLTRAMSQTRSPVDWPDHIAWYRRMLGSPDCEMFLAEQDGKRIGVIRADRAGGENEWEVSINIRPSARGGTGLRVLEAGCAEFGRRHPSARLVARISEANPASRRIFERLGFRRMGEVGETGFARYVLTGDVAGENG